MGIDKSGAAWRNDGMLAATYRIVVLKRRRRHTPFFGETLSKNVQCANERAAKMLNVDKHISEAVEVP